MQKNVCKSKTTIINAVDEKVKELFDIHQTSDEVYTWWFFNNYKMSGSS